MKFFKCDHLPEKLQEVSKPIWDLAEKSAGLRKLLEAKDCFVRSKLEG